MAVSTPHLGALLHASAHTATSPARLGTARRVSGGELRRQGMSWTRDALTPC